MAEPNNHNNTAAGGVWRRFLVRLPAFALLWWLLVEGRWDSWLLGGPAVIAAAAAAALLAPQQGWRWSVLGLVRFIPLFLRYTCYGGIDVAWRSLHPRLPIDPQLREHRLRLPEGAARTFFVNIISLMPGTVSADLEEDRVIVHALDGSAALDEQLTRLEQAVGELFAVERAPGNVRRGP